jgi:hypothetical protein
MAINPIVQRSDLVQWNLRLLDDILGTNSAKQIGVRLWDGTCWPDANPRPAVIALKRPGALRTMFLPGNELALGEAYIYDEFDIEGDVEKVFDLAEALAEAEAEGEALASSPGSVLSVLAAPSPPFATRMSPSTTLIVPFEPFFSISCIFSVVQPVMSTALPRSVKS